MPAARIGFKVRRCWPTAQVVSFLRRGHEERVRLLVPRVATVDAVVARAVPGAAELALTGRAAVPVRFLHRRRCVVVPLAGDDRLEGTVLAVPGRQGRVREDIVHVLEDVLPFAAANGTPTPAQRRSFARIDLVRPVAMVPDGFRVGWLNGFTRNLSAGGVLVTGAEALDRGDRLRVRFELDGEEDLVDLVARVVRAEDDRGLRGLRLERLDEALRDRLARYVHERQRRALAELRARAS